VPSRSGGHLPEPTCTQRRNNALDGCGTIAALACRSWRVVDGQLPQEEFPVKTGRPLILVTVGLYLLGLGVLMGVVIDRMKFDRPRSEVLSRYEEALRQWHTYQMTLEKQVRDH
jgi:hypothetical protein